jgi:glycogen(starch) synthase
MTMWQPARRILMTTDPIGGVWTYTLELCRELARRGVEVALASMGRSLTESERAEVRELPHVQVFESDFKLEWMTNPWHDVAAAGVWLADLASRIEPSVIHLNQFSHGARAWNAPCLVVGHSCVYSWFESVKGYPPNDDWRHYKRMVALGLRGADRVTAPSRSMLTALLRIYGPFAAAEPIYNGRARRQLVARPKKEFILTAGRLWDEAKNIAILERVAPKLPWPILAAGETLHPDGNRIGLANLCPLGNLDARTLGDRMADAAIFVLPARYEPFGLTVLEAALAGAALVLGDIPSLREIWHEAALFVAPDSEGAIITALSALIVDPLLRQQLARAAQLRALGFTTERMARAYLSLYGQLAAPSNPQAASVLDQTSPIEG